MLCAVFLCLSTNIQLPSALSLHLHSRHRNLKEVPRQHQTENPTLADTALFSSFTNCCEKLCLLREKEQQGPASKTDQSVSRKPFQVVANYLSHSFPTPTPIPKRRGAHSATYKKKQQTTKNRQQTKHNTQHTTPTTARIKSPVIASCPSLEAGRKERLRLENAQFLPIARGGSPSTDPSTTGNSGEFILWMGGHFYEFGNGERMPFRKMHYVNINVCKICTALFTAAGFVLLK
jgi:hypothetical protein